MQNTGSIRPYIRNTIQYEKSIFDKRRGLSTLNFFTRLRLKLAWGGMIRVGISYQVSGILGYTG